ncbi:polysaccharide biosynthesis protein [Deinococcus cellulosilyticus]|uniref:Polysaccharide biosynthesis protein CapD n=1 Tax=Deinococcus cellulosilyticus (strain DSM 18568 / NBRC 106333 / KACC 11606 / 5516J-15) TaxID=1223518 RepID=A0A511N3Z6_DEIC1|nr:nucleoside-diphosphate sugar epimerase/dehydratase [Deinococcus cellulosilyticus]GEM47604.1 polysaccharide biosynthesis protein CapD [Deinococcus cellulosilyticus NBRC 106333 = KACC 11606]
MRSVHVKFLVDLLVWGAAIPVAFWLRLGSFDLGSQYFKAMLYLSLMGVVYKSILILYFRMNFQVWQRFSLNDLGVLLKAVTASFLISTAISFYLPSVPRSVPLIALLVSIAGLTGIRFLVRSSYENARRVVSIGTGTSKRVMVIGAGDAGSMFVREMLRHPEQGLMPVALLDDDMSLRGKRIHGVPVAGGLDQLTSTARKFQADMVLFAIPSATGEVIRKVVNTAKSAGLTYKVVPALYELVGDQIQISQIRDVNLEDLLRRPPAELDIARISDYLKQKVILVTGAGGSIGSEVVRQIVRFYPRKVILFGRGENSIFTLQQELLRNWPEIEFITLIGDVRDEERLRFVFQQYRPQVVFHAAAHKHVPLMEDSPDQAVLNNIFGTRNVARMCLDYAVERFVNISTDKAVNPTSVMGTTKRIAEMLVANYAQKVGPGQAFMSVRFGNVLGSRGSVVPTFMRQIKEGGPITVTHPEMTRYFMTIPEASRLVLQAGGLAGNGNVYVLDMGQPVKIADLAHDLIQLSGAKNIEVTYTGMRPGEKLYEELLTSSEGVTKTSHQEILVARLEKPDEAWLREKLELLHRAALSSNYVSVRSLLREIVPESSVKLS